MADRPESLESVGRVSNGRQPRLMSCDECPLWTRSPLLLSLPFFSSRFLSSRISLSLSLSLFLSFFFSCTSLRRLTHAGFFAFVRILNVFQLRPISVPYFRSDASSIVKFSSCLRIEWIELYSDTVVDGSISISND